MLLFSQTQIHPLILQKVIFYPPKLNTLVGWKYQFSQQVKISFHRKNVPWIPVIIHNLRSI